MYNLLDYIIAKCEDPDNPPQHNEYGEKLISIFEAHNVTDLEMLATELMNLIDNYHGM